MLAKVAPIAELYRISTGLLIRSLDGLTREELLRSWGPDNNPILWQAAHLTATRCLVASALGTPHQPDWASRFGTGSKIQDPGAYPDVGLVTGTWGQVSDDLNRRLGELTDQELAVEFPRSLPVQDKSMLGALSFLAYHEAYHIGQMGYLRKWLGRGSLVG